MSKEIRWQKDHLKVSPLERSYGDLLFVGSGDSYAAGLAAQYASGGKAICYHPIDIVLNPELARNREVCIVSISGRTIANVLAAEQARKQGSRTIAVTAAPASLLARKCDGVIELRFPATGIPSAGTISFTTSLLTCVLIATTLQMPAIVRKLYARADVNAKRIARAIGSEHSVFVVLGNGLLFPIATYGALKLNEVFGAKAFPYPTEEFCHTPVFSIRKRDTIVVMAGDREQGTKDLNGRLRAEGFHSLYAGFDAHDTVELLLQSTFFVQLLVLRLALRRKIADCYFVQKKQLLDISSDFIYG